MLDIAISIAGGFNTVHDTFKKVCGIFRRDSNNGGQFDQLVTGLGNLTGSIERLSDNILYAPNLKAVENAVRSQQQYVSQLREVRETLEPLQKAIGSQLLSSAMILTPENSN